MPNLHRAESAPEPAADHAVCTGLPLLAAAELQDHLMIATSELERLQLLLAEACAALTQSFHGAAAGLQAEADTPGLAAVRRQLGAAVMALQFEDMAAQLIAHTSRRLRGCADRIAQDAMGDDDDAGPAFIETAPLRPNPVVQEDMSAGSIDLF